MIFHTLASEPIYVRACGTLFLYKNVFYAKSSRRYYWIISSNPFEPRKMNVPKLIWLRNIDTFGFFPFFHSPNLSKDPRITLSFEKTDAIQSHFSRYLSYVKYSTRPTDAASPFSGLRVQSYTANSSKFVRIERGSFAFHPYLRSWNADIASSFILTDSFLFQRKRFSFPNRGGKNISHHLFPQSPPTSH